MKKRLYFKSYRRASVIVEIQTSDSIALGVFEDANIHKARVQGYRLTGEKEIHDKRKAEA